MTSEEWERRMAFLLEQQARFDARLEKLHEEERVEHQHLRESDERLRESQATLTASLLRIAELVGDVTQAQKSTDERLNALISVVEKHITGPDHGRKAAN